MKLPDLLFLLVLLGTVITLIRLVFLAARRRWPALRRVGVRWSAFLAVYLAIVVIVSLLTPRHWVKVGEEQRFDDWCVTVERVEQSDDHYRLTIRVTNRARGRSQRAADANLQLVAADHRRFDPIAGSTERSLQSRLQPGESFQTIRDYEVPPDATIIGVDVIHGAWPQWFIVGDRGSLFHKRPLVQVSLGA